jgi:DHA1 family inner membrane transport protein
MISQKTLNVRVGLFTFSRLVVNTSSRMVYPFLAVFARGLNVEIGVISLAMAVSMATSAIGPFLAPIADRRGRKTGMLIGLGIFLAGSLSASLFPSLGTFFIAILLGNLGNNVFLPAMQAYLGDHVKYQRRGFYLAVTELSWALSFILFIPVAGIILKNSLWNGPFIWLSALGLLTTLLIWIFIPQDTPTELEPLTIFKDIKKVLGSTPAVLGMLMGVAFITGNELVNMVFGVWMQDSFGLQVAALGAVSAVIGFSELGGEGVAALLADRLGKEKTIGISFLLNGLWVITLPWLGNTEVGAFIWLFVFYLTFEVGVVSALPLMTEVFPTARATMMALFIAALSIGRALGGVTAPWLYKGGFLVNALVCLGLDLLSLVVLTRIKVQVHHPTE